MEFQLVMCSLFGRRKQKLLVRNGKQFGCRICNTTDDTPILLNDTGVKAKGKVVPVQALRHEDVRGSECIEPSILDLGSS
jgi:hypothetical protein